MSNDSSSPSTSLDAAPEAPLDWFLALLQEAMVGVMGDDQPALKKANALARLGSLYLKTYNTAELKRVNAELEERVAKLEERLTAAGVETAAGEEDATGPVKPEGEWSRASSRVASAKLATPQSHGRLRPAPTPPFKR